MQIHLYFGDKFIDTASPNGYIKLRVSDTSGSGVPTEGYITNRDRHSQVIWQNLKPQLEMTGHNSDDQLFQISQESCFRSCLHT